MQGEQLLRKNVQLGERKLGRNNPELLKPLMHLAVHLCITDRPNEAVKLYLRWGRGQLGIVSMLSLASNLRAS